VKIVEHSHYLYTIEKTNINLYGYLYLDQDVELNSSNVRLMK
jgi:hypothetical protein